VRVGIDYTPAHEQGGGIGRYVRELVSALAQLDLSSDYHLFTVGARPEDRPTSLPQNYHWHSTRLSPKWLARIWHRANLPLPVEQFTGAIDLFHATDFVLPPVRPTTRTLLTVHDLSFLRTPETASPRLRQYLSRVVPRSIALADHIIADSEATRRDILDVYNPPPEKVSVLLSGVSSHFHPVVNDRLQAQVRRKYGMGTYPYLFSVGTVQPRKNYARTVEALVALRQRGFDLHMVVAGGHGWLEDQVYKAINRYNVAEYVHFIGFADDADLPILYSGASVSIFASLYEGFGLPILESMACGTPVITSNLSSLPEVAGDVAPMVNPENADEIVVAVESLLTDTHYYDDMRERGLNHVKQFTWEHSAKQLRDLYQYLLTR
jgi:glycosyltransferase involved in cell wall biosynthesis